MQDDERARAVRELVAEWMRHAHSDMAVASLVDDERIAPEIAAFHAQQAAEKSLKALLVQRQVEFPRTHDIGVLLNLCQIAKYSDVEALTEISDLTRHAVVSRYPGEGDVMDREEARTAAALAESTLTWVEQRIEPVPKNDVEQDPPSDVSPQ